MRFFSPASLLAAGLVAVGVVGPYAGNVTSTRQEYHLELQLQAATATDAGLFADRGAGFATRATAQFQLLATTTAETYRAPLPPGTYHELRLTIAEEDSDARVSAARIVDRAGRTLRSLTAVAGATGGFTFAFDPPLPLRPPWLRLVGGSALVALVLFLTLAAGLFALHRGKLRGIPSLLATHPQGGLLVLALGTAVVSCYPVVFFGRSFVSPEFTYGTLLVYPRHPTVPGHGTWRTEYEKTSDTSALMWQHVAYVRVQRDALGSHGELPLWNRFNSGGAVLLAQGQSMFGHPLHCLLLLAGGEAWAWDAAFVLMKALFAAGIGLVVWQATRHLGAAALTTTIAPFIGFFVYRLNHPAIFSVCTAPWMLWCWLRLTHAGDLRTALRWTIALVVANGCELTSGTAKEAYMLLLAMNATGALVLVTARLSPAEKMQRLAIAAAAGGLFALAAAPVWMTFRDTLTSSYTMYNTPGVSQFPPAYLLGLFDELFLRPLDSMRTVIGPSANFAVGLGVAYALAALRAPSRARFPLVLLAGAGVAAALAFGIVPAAWISAVPLLRHVVHIDNTFTCVLLIHLLPLAGWGFAAAARRLATPAGRGDLALVATLFIALVGTYVLGFQSGSEHRTGTIRASGFVWDSLVLHVLAAAGFIGAMYRILAGRARTAATPLYAALCLGTLLWRHGQHLDAVFPDYVFNPPPRADLYTPSPALEWVRANQSAPSRVAGLDLTLSPGWSNVYGIETPTGPDGVVNTRYRELLLACGVELIWDWRFMTRPATLAAQRPVYDLLNVEYFAGYATDPAAPPAGLRFAHRSDLEIYRSDTVWPRAFFTDALAEYTAPADFAALIRAGDGRPFAAVQAGENIPSRPSTRALADRAIVPATDYRHTNHTTTFTVSAPRAGMVVLSETWRDGDIRVTLNGAPAPAFRVNHAFRGVALPAAGIYEITFRYWPRDFTARLIMSAVGWAGLAAAGVFSFRPSRRTRNE